MEIKKHSCKIGIFVINVLAVSLVVYGLKDENEDKFSLESTVEESITPVDGSIREIQNKIAVERENKLRDLNTAPKEIQQQNTITTTTTVTPPPPAPAKTPDKKSKTS